MMYMIMYLNVYIDLDVLCIWVASKDTLRPIHEYSHVPFLKKIKIIHFSKRTKLVEAVMSETYLTDYKLVSIDQRYLGVCNIDDVRIKRHARFFLLQLVTSLQNSNVFVIALVK